jgi:hypothetical protein
MLKPRKTGAKMQVKGEDALKRKTGGTKRGRRDERAKKIRMIEDAFRSNRGRREGARLNMRRIERGGGT